MVSLNLNSWIFVLDEIREIRKEAAGLLGEYFCRSEG